MGTTELQNQAIEIRDAENEGENTALRVGTMLLNIIGYLSSLVTINDANAAVSRGLSTYFSGGQLKAEALPDEFVKSLGAVVSSCATKESSTELLNLIHSRIILFDSMGSSYDGFSYTPEAGDIVLHNSYVAKWNGSGYNMDGAPPLKKHVIYVNKHTGKFYMWNGSAFEEVGNDYEDQIQISKMDQTDEANIPVGKLHYIPSQAKLVYRISSTQTWSWTPKRDRLYIDITDHTLYRWTGSSFQRVSVSGGTSVLKNVTFENGNLVFTFTTDSGDQVVSVPLDFNPSNYVPTTRTVNGKPLSDNVTINMGDIPGLNTALDSKANDSAVVKTITVNGETPAATPDQNGNVNVVVPTVVLDDAPTAGSNNGVKSGGVKQAIDDKLTEVVVNEMTGAADVITIDDADLAFIDEDGNIAMKVAEGHVETANFNSRQVATNTSAIQQLRSQIGQQVSVQTDVIVKEDADAAFDIADESGKVAMRITSQGHIKTKGFDSGNLDVFSQLKLEPQTVCHGYGSVAGKSNTVAYCRNGYSAGFRIFEIDTITCMDGKAVCGHYGNPIVNTSTSEQESIQVAAASNSAVDIVANYTFADGSPISLFEDVIWQVCYFYKCILWADWQYGNGMLAASTYAKSLGVEKYLFHYLNTNPFPTGSAYEAWGDIPCNVIAGGNTLTQIQTNVSNFKKPNNNVILKIESSVVKDTSNTDEFLKSLSSAIHQAGCYAMSSVYTGSDLTYPRRAFKCGADFVIASGANENNVVTITKSQI